MRQTQWVNENGFPFPANSFICLELVEFGKHYGPFELYL